METLDFSRSLAPVINLTDVPTLEAMLRASTCERINISIERPVGYSDDPISIPVRIIDGMDDIVSR